MLYKITLNCTILYNIFMLHSLQHFSSLSMDYDTQFQLSLLFLIGIYIIYFRDYNYHMQILIIKDTQTCCFAFYKLESTDYRRTQPS